MQTLPPVPEDAQTDSEEEGESPAVPDAPDAPDATPGTPSDSEHGTETAEEVTTRPLTPDPLLTSKQKQDRNKEDLRYTQLLSCFLDCVGGLNLPVSV